MKQASRRDAYLARRLSDIEDFLRERSGDGVDDSELFLRANELNLIRGCLLGVPINWELVEAGE